MRHLPTPFETVRAVARGYLPRILQPRGWTLAALAVLPVLAVAGAAVLAGHGQEGDLGRMGLLVYHQGLAAFVLPILALVAAPACIQEELEQRTLPLMLVRPVHVWVLPLGKGLLWFLWGSGWLLVSVASLLLLGLAPGGLPLKALGLVLLFWAELGIVALMLQFFRRGVLWSALLFFIWESLVTVLPSNLQRLTLVHYLESLVGSRASSGGKVELLAQVPIESPAWVAALVLLGVGAAAWVLCGMKLRETPVGLAGREAEG